MKTSYFYVTYGEEKSLVYRTQVIEYLNKLAKRRSFDVYLVQIAFSSSFIGLDNCVKRIYIPRQRNFLYKRNINHYVAKLEETNLIDDKSIINSRGMFAFNIIKTYLIKTKIKCYHNYDIMN